MMSRRGSDREFASGVGGVRAPSLSQLVVSDHDQPGSAPIVLAPADVPEGLTVKSDRKKAQ